MTVFDGQVTPAAGTEGLDVLVERVRESVLKGSGVTETGLRQGTESRAAAMSGRLLDRGGNLEAIPANLSDFADKVARSAWQVTAKDVESLMESGYTQDEVFEVTVSAALGASHGRLERGLAALRGEV